MNEFVLKVIFLTGLRIRGVRLSTFEDCSRVVDTPLTQQYEVLDGALLNV